MTASKDKSSERRHEVREHSPNAPILKLHIVEPLGTGRSLKVELIDSSAGGFCIVAVTQFSIGTRVEVSDGARLNVGGAGRVVWTRPDPHGGFQHGVRYEGTRAEHSNEAETAPDDYYELLQVNPKAQPDTIHRVYRLLAQRYHPDNADTGDALIFKRLLAAYQTLNDPEKRAAYDLTRADIQKRRWRIFDRKTAAQGAAAERRKRAGILALLYTRRMTTPDSPNVSLAEMEDLLGIPRDHLDFGLWYLREQTFLLRSDGGKFAITAKGVDEAERIGAVPTESGQLALSGPKA